MNTYSGEAIASGLCVYGVVMWAPKGLRGRSRSIGRRQKCVQASKPEPSFLGAKKRFVPSIFGTARRNSSSRNGITMASVHPPHCSLGRQCAGQDMLGSFSVCSHQLSHTAPRVLEHIQ